MPPPLGQIAYEAYCQTRNWHSSNGQLLPPWHDQAPELKTAWEAAAQSVKANLPQPQTQTSAGPTQTPQRTLTEACLSPPGPTGLTQNHGHTPGDFNQKT